MEPTSDLRHKSRVPPARRNPEDWLPRFLQTERELAGLELVPRVREREKIELPERPRRPPSPVRSWRILPPHSPPPMIPEWGPRAYDTVYSSADAKDVTVHLEADVVSDIDDELEWLNRQMRIGNFRSAKAFFDSHLKAHSHQVSVYVQYAEMLIRMKDYKSVRLLDNNHVLEILDSLGDPNTRKHYEANWRLIQAVAMSYSQLEIAPIRDRLGPRLGTIFPVTEESEMSSTGIRILCLSMELYRRTGLLTSAGPWTHRGVELSDWADWKKLYRQLLAYGLVWDLHDVFVSASATYGVDNILEEFFGRRGLESLDRLIADWNTTEMDESTQLALLDILSIAVLHSNMFPTDFPVVRRYLDRANLIGESLMTQFPGSIKSRPFLHWVLAKVVFSARTKNVAPFAFDHASGFPGLLMCPLSLGSSCISIPYYVPIGQENPGLWAPKTTARDNEPLDMALRASEELEDYHIQQLCLKELILRSQDPSVFFAQLTGIQKATQNMDGHFSTCLSRYLICKNEGDKRQLSVDLAGLGWWENPQDLISPSRAAARDIIQVAVLDHGFNSIPQSIAAGLRYYQSLPSRFQLLIDRHCGPPRRSPSPLPTKTNREQAPVIPGASSPWKGPQPPPDPINGAERGNISKPPPDEDIKQTVPSKPLERSISAPSAAVDVVTSNSRPGLSQNMQNLKPLPGSELRPHISDGDRRRSQREEQNAEEASDWTTSDCSEQPPPRASSHGQPIEGGAESANDGTIVKTNNPSGPLENAVLKRAPTVEDAVDGAPQL